MPQLPNLGLSRVHWFVDHSRHRFDTTAPNQSRELVLRAIESGGNSYLIVFVASIGFFTDSYMLFSSNVITQMLGYVYWNGSQNSNHEVAFNAATLSGTMFGMIIFGWLGDKWGRRKMYGYELLLLIAGTVGLLMSSTGYVPPYDSTAPDHAPDWTSHGSLNIYSLTLFWRFVTGVGIGGDYPLSAVIVSEFAPTKSRARMLAAVFSMQAFGFTAASIVSLIVIAIARPSVSLTDSEIFTGQLQRSVDQAWRWIIGLGLIPALLAVVLRLTTPESARYTLDVASDPVKAFDEANRFKTANLEVNWRDAINLDTIRDTITPPKAETAENEDDLDQSTRLMASGTTVKSYFFANGFLRSGNWTVLVGTSLAWFFLDIGFYALSLNSPGTISKIWYTHMNDTGDFNKAWATDPEVQNPQRDIFDILAKTSQHSLIISSVGSMVGAILMIAIIDRFNRKRFQTISFVVLGIVFIITGVCYRKTVGTDYHGVTIVFYCLCQLLFYLGPNTLTFIIPAELFITKYRATSHGISAAAGKLGSIIISVIFGLHGRNDFFGYLLIIFALPMFLGAIVTQCCIPDLQDKHLKNLDLETLGYIKNSSAGGAQIDDEESN